MSSRTPIIVDGLPIIGSASNTPDLNELVDKITKDGDGIAFFLFPFPKKPSKHDFPVPTILPPEFAGFLDFSDSDSSDMSPRVFNQIRHVYALTREKILLYAVVGPAPGVFVWAQQWMNGAALEPRYKHWLKEAVWLPHTDLLEMGGDVVQAVEEQVEHVDLDDQKSVEGVVYDSEPTEQEVEKILDEGPSEEDREEMDRLDHLRKLHS